MATAGTPAGLPNPTEGLPNSPTRGLPRRQPRPRKAPTAQARKPRPHPNPTHKKVRLLTSRKTHPEQPQRRSAHAAPSPHTSPHTSPDSSPHTSPDTSPHPHPRRHPRQGIRHPQRLGSGPVADLPRNLPRRLTHPPLRPARSTPNPRHSAPRPRHSATRSGGGAAGSWRARVAGTEWPSGARHRGRQGPVMGPSSTRPARQSRTPNDGPLTGL